MQRGGGVLQADEAVEEVRHLDAGVAALLLGAQDVGDHLCRHGGVQVHVPHLRHVELMSPAPCPGPASPGPRTSGRRAP